MDDATSPTPRWMQIVLPAIGVALILAVWQALAVRVNTPGLLPSPMQTLLTLATWTTSGGFGQHLSATMLGALGGLAIGAGLGLVAGVIVGEVRVLERTLYPVALALQAMPVVAIGTFFVMFINAVAGMHAAPTELSDMARAFGGSRWQIALRIKLPSAWDYIFGALEVCAALSFILCVVGEFLAAKAGLGYYLRSASNNIDAAAMFAALIVLSLLATALALTVRLAHHRTVFWKYQRH